MANANPGDEPIVGIEEVRSNVAFASVFVPIRYYRSPVHFCPGTGLVSRP
ncbi:MULTISPECIES: hypothetical protein [Salinirubellus]